MKTQSEQLIAHANQVAKANFMQFDYDEDNPITDLLQAVLVIAFDNNIPEGMDGDMGPIYDELSEEHITHEALKDACSYLNSNGINAFTDHGTVFIDICEDPELTVEISKTDTKNFAKLKNVQETIAETHAEVEDFKKVHIIGACMDEDCPTCNPKQYPFNEGDDYWTIEGGKVTWSCWDDVSEVIHDNESRRIYFSTEQEAINHLKN